MKFFYKLWKERWQFRNLLSTIFFNFHYLPFRQALHLPIILYKPNFIKLKGKITISSDKPIKHGMIKLGYLNAAIYSNSGIVLEIAGSIVFHGRCTIGRDSKICVGENAVLEFGDNSLLTAAEKIVCWDYISLGNNALVGWECLLLDTDFHSLSYLDDKSHVRSKPIIIGDDTWLATGCKIYKGTVIPSKCVVSANSICNKKYDEPEYTMFAGFPAKAVKHGVWLDRTNSSILPH